MQRNLVIITSFILIGSIFGLFGCDNGRNTEAICKNNPELCDDLHKDSWCRFEKGELIRSRFELKQTQSPSGLQLYKQLTYLEDYSHCVELAAGVQHILNPERSNERARAFGFATQNLAELQESTKGNPDLYLSYYHWARFNDNAALNRLLTAEREGKISDPLLLSHLAAHYLKFDAIKAKSLYLKVLAVSPPSELNPDWLLGLANSYRKENDLEHTYMLSRANILITKQRVSDDQMLALLSGNKALAAQLDEQASNLTKALLSGDYADSEIRKTLEAQPIAPAQSDAEVLDDNTHNIQTTEPPNTAPDVPQ